MKKFWLVFLHEYKRHVMRKRFVFAILSMPLFVAFIVFVGFLSVWLQYNNKPVGYIDQYQILTNPQQVPVEKKSLFDKVPALAFEDEDAAKAALDEGKIQAYFTFSENYMSTGEVTMTMNEKPGSNAEDDFGDFVTLNLVKGMPEPIIERLTDGSKITVRSMDGSREMGADNWMVMLLPLLAGVLFMIAVNISGGYLMQAVVEEKENRTMEIMVTSVSPTQLMAGKVVGDLLVGLTQLVVWIVFLIIGLKVAPLFIPDMGTMPSIDPKYVLLIAGTMLPAFVMISAAMGAMGATATQSQEAQQMAGFFTLPIVVPFWFVSQIMFNPNGPLSVGMSMFPFTAPIALPLRAGFTNIPWWQTSITITVLVILALFSLWLSGKIFRIGMLRYGKKVSLKEAFRRS
ncbi:ABC transporter permease [bacterium]|nr:ABC transporter permease [bacterium]